ncbi:amidohydrolase family protein [Streptomyces sp. NBC_01508]|uniref:amidohydrolase family protein n=1 Tax=Streptomyces sp. NBC_01508 TaxID=2903888 RepID=UPI00386B2D8C
MWPLGADPRDALVRLCEQHGDLLSVLAAGAGGTRTARTARTARTTCTARTARHPVHQCVGVGWAVVTAPGDDAVGACESDGTAVQLAGAVGAGVFQRHPGPRLILAHCGGALPTLGWRIGEHTVMGRGPDDADIDPAHVAEVLRRLYYDTALAGSRNSLLPTLEVTTPDHLLFGTDWPAAPEPPQSYATSATSPPSTASRRTNCAAWSATTRSRSSLGSRDDGARRNSTGPHEERCVP